MGFIKKYYNKENIIRIAKNDDVDKFINYFKSDGYIFEDDFSNNVYLKMVETLKIKNDSERIRDTKNIMISCQL